MTDELRDWARDVIRRVDAGEPVLLDPEKATQLTQGFTVMSEEEVLARFLPADLHEPATGGL